MSRKPCSSNSEHSHSADSTSASGVALPYLASSRLSSEPALTPILIGIPASAAALAISATLSSNCLMLPGLTRTAAQPASIAANTYFGWKWMSAMTGICDFFAMAGSASASSWDGTATRTIWHPEAVSSAICCSVAFTLAVSVVVMDWTVTGAPPPTGTEPTMIWRDSLRGASKSWASGAVGACGIPRSVLIAPIRSVSTTESLYPAIVPSPGDLRGRTLTGVSGISRPLTGYIHRVHDVGQDQHDAEEHQHHEDAEADRQEFGHVHHARVGALAQPGEPGPDPLPDDHRDVPAVQRQQREHVEGADEDVERGDEQQHEADLVLPADVGCHRRAGGLGRADHAAHLPGGRAAPVLAEQLGQRGGQRRDRLDRADQDLAERRTRVLHGADRAGHLEHHGRRDAEVGAAAAADRGQRGVQGEGLAGALRWQRSAEI